MSGILYVYNNTQYNIIERDRAVGINEIATVAMATAIMM